MAAFDDVHLREVVIIRIRARRIRIVRMRRVPPAGIDTANGPR